MGAVADVRCPHKQQAKKTPPKRGFNQLQVVEVIAQPVEGAISLNHSKQSKNTLP